MKQRENLPDWLLIFPCHHPLGAMRDKASMEGDSLLAPAPGSL